MEQKEILMRKERGKMIAQTSRITQTNKGWRVPSQSGHGYYLVVSNGLEAKCNCPDHETRQCKCKHIWAVELIVTKEIDNEGNVTITKTIRKTYKQDWGSYDMATTNQKPLFMKLLKDMTNNVEQPTYKFGRPSLPLSDMIYSSVMKVFTTFSLRRFMGDIQIAKEKGYIHSKPCYASVGHFLQRKDLTPTLIKLVTLTSLPLKAVENDFAVDATGFGTNVFQRWYSFKHGKDISSRRWVKCHFMTGIRTNIVSSVKITTEFDNDSPEFKGLVDTTSNYFDMNEVSADKAYLSKENLELIDDKGATAYIPFKSNSIPNKNGKIWRKMYHYFMLNNEEFLEHYHKRSNVESTVHMIKSKFGDSVKSKTWTAQVNEVLCKVICHNICVIIQEIYELGIAPNFCVESKGGVYKVDKN